MQYLIYILMLLTYLNCSSNSEGTPESEEKAMSFELKGISYPVQYANLQRNSYVPVELKAKWKPAWSRKYIEVNEEMTIAPYAVQVKDDFVGLKSASEMLFYDTAGKYQYMLEHSGTSEIFLGRQALAYIHPSYQMTYQDYEKNVVGEPGPIPRLKEWSHALLMKPSLDNVLAVIQFTGGPMRSPKKYFVYKFLREDGSFIWYQEIDGTANHALLTNDAGNIVVVSGNKVILYSCESGDTVKSFMTDLDDPITASLDINDNLLILGEQDEGEKVKRLLKMYALSGEETWTFETVDPFDNQPPACGGDGRVYIIDSNFLICIRDGSASWKALLKPAEDNWLTVTSDNYAIVVNGSLLSLFNPDGEKISERLITKFEESFYAPAALDRQGRVYVASDKALYCFE